MNPLVLVICSAIIGCLLFVVCLPLVRARSNRIGPLPDWQRSRLAEQRDRVYAAIRELDFDRAVRKVNEDDYRLQRATLEQSAVDILRELDQLGGADTAVVEERVMADVADLWSGTADPHSPPSLAREALAPDPADACPSCGGSVASDHRFCPHCGAHLHVAE